MIAHLIHNNETVCKCSVGSIRKICQRLNDEGYSVSDYAIRRWVKEGKIPAVYSGTKAIIAYDAVKLFITKH